MSSLKQIISLLRLSHWPKAAFVLLGVIYTDKPGYFHDALLAAFSFCLISSAVYIYNDVQDRKEDKLHPSKCYRPLVNNEVSLVTALSLLAALMLTGLFLAWSISTSLLALIGIYLLINLAYNHLLKNIPVLDVLCIASGFMLRILAGTIGIGLSISPWLTLSATLICLFVALCKRRLEKQMDLNLTTRAVLEKYSFRLLDNLNMAVALAAFLSYFLYTIYSREQPFYFLLTLPFAAIGLWRFASLTTRDLNDDDPLQLFLSDHLSRINFFCFLTLTSFALAR